MYIGMNSVWEEPSYNIIMYIYIHIRTYVLPTYTYVHILCIYVRTYVRTYVHMCMYVYVCICT